MHLDQAIRRTQPLRLKSRTHSAQIQAAILAVPGDNFVRAKWAALSFVARRCLITQLRQRSHASKCGVRLQGQRYHGDVVLLAKLLRRASDLASGLPAECGSPLEAKQLAGLCAGLGHAI